MKIFKSSVDPQKVSLAVKGFLAMLVPVVMVVTGIPEAELTGITELISQAVFYGVGFVGAVQLLYGLGRKVYMGRWSAAK